MTEHPPGTAHHHFGRFEIRMAERQLRVDGQPVALGARAFDVLVALAERRERIVPKSELLDVAWPGLIVEENNLQAGCRAMSCSTLPIGPCGRSGHSDRACACSKLFSCRPKRCPKSGWSTPAMPC